MFSKCSCCDQRNATVYVPNREAIYCSMCHAEMFYFAEFDEGYQQARRDIDYNIYDAEASILSFEGDPPACPRHWGYLQACIHEVENV